MNFLLIPDKFKGSISAEGVIQALSKGIKRALPESGIYSVMASDGGDGFLQAVSTYVEGEMISSNTVDPLGRTIKALYLLNRKTGDAYIELAAASGLVLLKETERDPLLTSTFGTGQQIRHAIQEGATSIFLGLGGSATNDGGIGIAAALGYQFLDADGNLLKPLGGNLEKIHTIDVSGLPEKVQKVSFAAINDVNNPLFGKNGAAYIYAAQKGAGAKEIKSLDAGLRQLDRVVEEQLQMRYAREAGAGAAGGTSYGLKVFFNAAFISGIHFVLKLAQIPALLSGQQIDYIITGEGKIDRQTMSGKLINGVLELGHEFNIPVMAVCGMLDADRRELKKVGLHEVIEIRNPEKSLQFNMANAGILLEDAICSYFDKK